MSFPDPPAPFLEVKIHDISICPSVCALCAGYEGGEWRARAFAEHTMEWLPEFCLTAEELEDFRPGTAVKMIRKAARLVYQTDKYKSRGEFGELFLHIALRQVHKSIPAISKIYWKDSINNTIKGYDAVHVVEVDGELQLWLGEVKFYEDANDAIRDVVKEIDCHTKMDYMKNEVALIANKLDRNSSHYSKLSKLLDTNTSLDQVFDVACIPALITYNSSALKKHRKVTSEYNKELQNEVMSIRETFKNKLSSLSLPVRIHLFLIPLNEKKVLIKYLDESLKGFQ